MDRRKLSSVLIVLLLLCSIGHTILTSDSANAAFIMPLSNNGMSSTFVAQDTTWNDAGTIAVVVGYDATPGMPNAYVYYYVNDTYAPLDNGGFDSQRLYSVDYYAEAVYGWGGTKSDGSPDVSGDSGTQPIIAQQPLPDDGPMRQTLVYQDFTSATFPPAGWGTQTSGTTGTWARLTNNYAGGVSPEAYFRYNAASGQGTSRLYVGPINANGISNMKLQWQQYIWDNTDPGHHGVRLSIQTSADGSTWHDAGWYWDDIQMPGTIVATPKSLDVSTVDVGSSTLYISWTVTGDSHALMYWFLDNILLTGSWTDDMESGTNGWTASGFWHQVQDGVDIYSNSHSPTTSWWYGQDATGTFDNGAPNSGRLESPVLDLTGSVNTRLRFWEWYQTENAFPTYDQRWVEIYAAGAWTRPFAQLDEPAQTTWQERTIDLSAYDGQTIRIGFFFDTIDAGANAYRGWYIDDVTVSNAYAVGMTPEFQNKYGFPSQVVDYTLTATNQGLLDDTYDLSVAGNVWPTALLAESGAALDVGAQTGTYSGFTRGYWFTAPCDFTITGLRAPADYMPGEVQNVQVVRFNSAVPVFSATTNDFSSLGYWTNVAGTSFIPCSISINSGEIIGVLGGRGGVATQYSSYRTAPYATTINGYSITLARLGMQYNLNTVPAKELWTEAASSIARVEMEYTIDSMYLNPGESKNFLARVTIPAGATPSNFDLATVTATSRASPTVSANAQVRTKVPGGILSTVPANGATGIAITSSVVVTFGEPMVTASVAYTCSPNPGGWVASWNTPTNTILTLTHTAFAYNTLYTFQVTAGTDIYGNPLGASVAANPWTFRTVGATATATGPTGGPTNIGTVTLAYTWTDTPTSVNLYYTTSAGSPYTWVLAGNDATVDGSFVYTIVSGSGSYRWLASAVGGGSVEPSPPSNLVAPETGYYYYDVTAPSISATTPANLATGVSRSQSIIVTFGEAMNTGSVTYSCSPDPGGWVASWNGPTNTVLTLTHTDFAYLTTYTFRVLTATDVAGNSLAAGGVPNPWTFTTLATASATATGPTTATPTNVAAVTITYAMAGDAPTSVNLYYTTDGGTTWVLAGNDATPDGSFAYSIGLSGVYTIGWIAQAVGGGSVELSPPTSGTAPEAASYLFDTARPTIQYRYPGVGLTGVAITAQINIRFSETMNTGSFTFTCSPDPGGWSSAWSMGVYPNDRIILSHNAFAYFTTYTFTITGATDLAGNTVNPTPASWSFTTTGATATATGPTGGPTSIATVTLTYNWIDTPTSVNLYYTTSAGSPYTWVLAGNDPTVDGSFSYTITGGSGAYRWLASAVGGNSVEPSPPATTDAPESGYYYFDVDKPTIASTTPASAATGVSRSQSIVVTFSEAMNTASVTYSCLPNPGGWVASWNTPTNTVLTLTHTNFAYLTTYTFTVTAGTDVAGNSLAPGAVPNPWTFTTLATATATATGPISATATNIGAITMTYTLAGEAPTSVNLYYTTNGGTTWTLAGNDATPDGSFAWAAPSAGTYGWIAQAVGGGSTEISPPTAGTPPEATPYIYDNVSPTITVTSPANGVTSVAVTTNVVITFSEAMNTASVTYTCSPDPGGWSASWNGPTNTQLTLSHNSFAFYTVYTVTVTAATDVAGNPLVAGVIPNPWSFRTIGATATAAGPTGGPSNVAAVTLTYTWQDTPTSVNLYYTKSTASPYTWVLAGNDPTVDGSFSYTITGGDGSYWWYASAVGGNSIEPSPPSNLVPPETAAYILDTMAPAPPTGLTVQWYNTLLYQDFTAATFPPAGWAQSGPTSQWSRSATAVAGGAAGEARFQWVSNTDIWRLYAGPIDTTGLASLDLQFRQFIDAYAAGSITLKVQTSTDLITWNDAGWTWPAVATNYGPVQEYVTVNTADVGSSTFYISWTVDGYAYNIDAWYIDNVVLSHAGTGFTNDNKLSWTKSADDGAGANDVNHYNIYRASSAAGPWDGTTLIASVSAGTTSYFDLARGEPDGINWWYVVRAVDNAGNMEMNTNAVAEDPTPPTIVSTIPVNGFTGTAINQNVVVTFSEEMNPGTFAYTCSPDPGGWSAVWTTVTFPNDRVILSHTNFAYGTTYTFTVTAATDIAGNALAAGAVPNPWSFTTIAAASATATGPTGGPTNVGAITITYTYTGVPTSVNLYYTTNGGTTWNYFGNDALVDGTMTIVLGSSGTYGWIMQAVGGGSTEPLPPAAGTPPEAAPYIFDNVRPTVSSTVPSNGAANVAITQSIVITFSEAVNTASFTLGASFTISPNPGGLSVVWSGGNTIATVSHTAFAYNTLYTCTITTALRDLAGNTMLANYAWSFTTVAAASATAIGPTGGPTNVAGITVSYTYTGVPTSVNIYYTTNGGTAWSLWGSDATVDGSYAITLTASGTYGWIAQAVGGGSTESIPPAAGTLPEAASYIFDNVRPTVSGTVPPNGATNVIVSQSVIITFSEAVNTATFVLGTSFTMSPNPGGLSVAWSGGNTIATIGHNAFAYGTTYTCTVTTGVSDAAGNTLLANYAWSFTTVAAASATATGPTGGPTNVASITISYTYTGFPISVNIYYTTDAGANWLLAGNDASVDGSFPWTIPYSWGTFAWFASAVGGGSTEPSPPASATPPEIGSYIYDSVSPTITATNPADSAVNVPVTQSIVITFSETINGGTLGFTCTPDPGGWGGSWFGTTLTLTHAAFLHDTAYTFSVTVANDLAGNPLAAGSVPNPWTFTTAAGATATAFAPTGGPTNIAGVIIAYSYTGSPTSVNLYYSTDDGATWAFVGNDAFPDGSFMWTIPSSGTYHWIAQAVGDGSTEPVPPPGGELPEAGPYIFDNDAPYIISVSPSPGATDVLGNALVIINFNEPMDDLSGSITIDPNPGGITFSWSNGGMRLTVTHSPFPENTLITVYADFFTDAAGNQMDPPQTSWSFTTSEMTIVGYRDIFWVCGDKLGGPPATVYRVIPYESLQLAAMNDASLDPEFRAVAVDSLGNPLCAGAGLPYMYYFDGTQWVLVPDDLGDLSLYNFESMDFNPNDGRFYAGSYFNLFCTDPVPLSAASRCRMFNNFTGNGDDITCIAWNELYDYGLVAEGPEVFKIWPYGYYGNGNLRFARLPGSGSGDWYRDISWDSDGWNEAGIVGSNGGDRAYWRYYHTNPRLISGYVGSAGIYQACAMKPPASPKWLFVPFSDQSIKVHIMEKDESDRVVVGVDSPRIFAIDMWKRSDPMRASVMGTALEANTTYTFFLEGNYTVGGWDCWDPAYLQLSLTAWYDNGNTGASSAPGDPTWSSGIHRTRQFRLFYTPGSAPVMNYPFGSPNEFSVHSYYETAGFGTDGSHRRLLINITFGPQSMYSAGNLALPVAYPWLPNAALNDPNTWDLNATLVDVMEPAAVNSSYQEFGVRKLASISSWGSPSGSIPPGSVSAALDSPSYVLYSINAPYTLNVSIPNLYRNGNLALGFIPANMVEVVNSHPNANGINSDIAPLPVSFLGPDQDLCVWGRAGSYIVPEPENGNISAGPGYTDYVYPVFLATRIEWAVTVDVGIQEGVYRGTITLTLWS